MRLQTDPDRHLWGRRRLRRQLAPPGSRARHAVQHLHAQRPAADADRAARCRLDRSGRRARDQRRASTSSRRGATTAATTFPRRSRSTNEPCATIFASCARGSRSRARRIHFARRHRRSRQVDERRVHGRHGARSGVRRRHDARAGRHARSASSVRDWILNGDHGQLSAGDRSAADVRCARAASRRSDPARARGRPVGRLRPIHRRHVRLSRRRPRRQPRLCSRRCEREVQKGLEPDLTLLLDAPLDVGASRIARAHAGSLRARAAAVLRARAGSVSIARGRSIRSASRSIDAALPLDAGSAANRCASAGTRRPIRARARDDLGNRDLEPASVPVARTGARAVRDRTARGQPRPRLADLGSRRQSANSIWRSCSRAGFLRDPALADGARRRQPLSPRSPLVTTRWIGIRICIGSTPKKTRRRSRSIRSGTSSTPSRSRRIAAGPRSHRRARGGADDGGRERAAEDARGTVAGESYLLLLSHQPGRLPATVRSRCQHLALRAPEHAKRWRPGSALRRPSWRRRSGSSARLRSRSRPRDPGR